jgi:hypothetical protein
MFKGNSRNFIDRDWSDAGRMRNWRKWGEWKGGRGFKQWKWKTKMRMIKQGKRGGIGQKWWWIDDICSKLCHYNILCIIHCLIEPPFVRFMFAWWCDFCGPEFPMEFHGYLKKILWVILKLSNHLFFSASWQWQWLGKNKNTFSFASSTKFDKCKNFIGIRHKICVF